MTDQRGIIDALITLFEDTLEVVPEGSRGLICRQFTRIKAEYETAPPPTAFPKGGGPAAYWKHYRENQQFKIEIRGGGEYVMTGVDAVAAHLEMKPTTFRQRMSTERGKFHVMRHWDGIDKVITVTRIAA
jgi:hypothetical protein